MELREQKVLVVGLAVLAEGFGLDLALGALAAGQFLLTVGDVRSTLPFLMAAGLFALADRFGVELVGGDTTRRSALSSSWLATSRRWP